MESRKRVQGETRDNAEEVIELGRVSQLLRPGGRLIISTPYHGNLKNPFIALSNKWDSHLSPPWDGGHIKLWSRKVSASFASSERAECLCSERA